MYRVDPARHGIARALARVINDSGAAGGSFEWAEHNVDEPCFPVVTLGRLAGQSHRAFAGYDHVGRRWMTVVHGATRGASSVTAAGAWAALAALPRPSDADLDRSTPAREHLVWLVDQMIAHGWALPGHITRALARQLGGKARQCGDLRILTVAEALEEGGLTEVGRAFLCYARAAANENLLGEATEAYRWTYEVALAGCNAELGLEAAWQVGRTLRRSGRWPEALRWYEHAAALADSAADFRSLALVLEGTAMGYLDRGATPTASRVATRAHSVAKQSGDAFAIAATHRTCGAVSRVLGDLPRAMTHHWKAARIYPDIGSQAHALMALGSVARESGNLDMAENAYRRASENLEDPSMRVLALDALAYVAALRGDAAAYESAWRDVEADLPVTVPRDRAQILFYRAKALGLLGRTAAAAAHRAAIEYSREHGFLQYSERSELALEALPPVPIRDKYSERIEKWLVVPTG